jgi:hypothetical protein
MVELMNAIAATAFVDDDMLEDDMSEPNWADMRPPQMIGSPLRLIASQSLPHFGDSNQRMRLAA